MLQDTKQYEDIIHLPHHVSSNHPQMDVMNRAAQFSPFAALTGYEDAIIETGRMTDSMVHLEEDELEYLDEKLELLRYHLSKKMKCQFTYFVPDLTKDGGSYQCKEGIVKRIEDSDRIIILEDGTHLLMETITKIDILDS